MTVTYTIPTLERPADKEAVVLAANIQSAAERSSRSRISYRGVTYVQK